MEVVLLPSFQPLEVDDQTSHSSVTVVTSNVSPERRQEVRQTLRKNIADLRSPD